MDQRAEVSGSQARGALESLGELLTNARVWALPLEYTILLALGDVWALVFFNSFPGDSNMQPGLRTTGLEMVSTTHMKYTDNIIRSPFYYISSESVERNL